MLKANELRIGNLVSDIHAGDAFYDEIKQITKERVYYGNFHSYPSDLKPILLTEEWLLKFGFERQENNWKTLDLIFCIISWERLAGLALSFEKESIFLPHIKYIHQLQNLYFALTGEELNLK